MIVDVSNYSLKKKIHMLINYLHYVQVELEDLLEDEEVAQDYEDEVDAWIEILLNGQIRYFNEADFFGTEGIEKIIGVA